MQRFDIGAVVVAQLAERSLPTSEIRGSIPNIGKVFRYYRCISVNCNSEKTNMKQKRPGCAHLKKIVIKGLDASDEQA